MRVTWIALCGLACRDGSTSSDAPHTTPPPTTDTGTPTPPTSTPDPTTPTTPAPPDLVTALGDCGGTQRDPGDYPNQLKPGDDFHRLLLDDPAAVCNDGTPAPVYLRAATDPAHANDWAFHFQGGSECVTYEECQARWCGSGFYDASKMSSNWTPETMGGRGMMSADATLNAFAGWNQVYFYYCSSDFWMGQSVATLTGEDGAVYTVERRGHQIYAATLAQLEVGAVSDDGLAVMPDPAAADVVAVSGTSAGAIGAEMHTDDLAARWPNAEVFGVFDALMLPRAQDVDPALAAAVDDIQRERVELRTTQEAVPPFVSAACDAAKAEADRWECAAGDHIVYEWVAAPFVQRQDRFDPITASIYLDAGGTVADLAAGLIPALAALSAQTQSDGAHPAVFAPTCGEHVGLEDDPWFFEHPIDLAPGPLTLHGITAAAAEGARLLAIDADGTRSQCN